MEKQQNMSEQICRCCRLSFRKFHPGKPGTATVYKRWKYGNMKKVPDIASCQNGLMYSLRKTGKYRKCFIKNGLPFESIVPEPELSYMPYYSSFYKVYQDKNYLLRILPFSLSDIFGFVCLEVSKKTPVALKYKKGAPWREHPCTCVSINFLVF